MTSVRVKSAGPVHLPAASGDGTSGSPLNLKVVACDETGTPYSVSNPLPVDGDFGGAGGAVDTALVTVTGTYPLTSDLSAVVEANVKIATEEGPGTLTVTIGASTGFARRIVDVVSGPGDVTPFTVAFADAVILGAWDGLADAWFQRFDCVPDGAGEWYAYRVPYFAAEVASGGGAVDSVNGDTGVVVLTAADVGAEATGVAAALVDDLSGVSNASTARTNLGLGTAAVTNTGTGSSNTILGNDARLTDTRTPTDASVSVAKFDATQAARLTALDTLLWRPVDMDLMFPSSATSGTWAVAQNSAGMFGGWVTNSAGTANGDYIQWANVPMPAGTYTVALAAQKTTGSGILDILIDGVSLGTVDLYNGSTVTSYYTATTSYAPSSTALVTVKLLLNGKNASSSGYLARISRLIFKRTA